MAKACTTCSRKDARYLITTQHVKGPVCPKCHKVIEKAAKKCKKGGTINLILNEDGDLVVNES